MALRLVRETSQTPNVTNKDDVRMVRYAYGGYNGVVKAFGSECDYTAESGIFKILDGRIVLDGWEIDIDGAGWSLNLSSVTGTQYYSIYLSIDISIETAVITSTYLQGVYPEITKGDDLTTIPNGTARLLLYNVKVENGRITEVIKRFEIIPYLANIEKSLKDGTLKPKIAQYASEDISKGTIEERLSRLGFKSGVIKFSGVDYGSKDYLDTEKDGIYRQGNYVFCKIETSSKLLETNIIASLNGRASDMFSNIPDGFRPKNEPIYITVFARGSNGSNPFYYTCSALYKILTTGEVLYLAISGDSLSITRWQRYEFTTYIEFGYEAPLITE